MKPLSGIVPASSETGLQTASGYSMRQKNSDSSQDAGNAPESPGQKFLYSGDELDAMEEAQRYHCWILRHFRPYLGKRIMEIGAGTGSFASILIESAPHSEFFLFEPAANLFPLLERRYQHDARVRTYNASLDARAASLAPDTVVMVNVLEHIEDDLACLRQTFSVLAPGGNLLLFAPALPALYGSLDRAFGHFRRYGRTELLTKLQEANFRVHKVRYFNFVGVATWFFSGRILKRTTVPVRDVRFYDLWIVPPASWLEQRWEPPLGQSVVAIAQKPTAG